jgi:mRNA interferase RelE/StbE
VQVRYLPPALRDLRRLDRQTAARILAAVARYARAGQGDIRRLQGRDREWRLRVGDWRVIFAVQTDTDTLVVLRVRHRSQAYAD